MGASRREAAAGGVPHVDGSGNQVTPTVYRQTGLTRVRLGRVSAGVRQSRLDLLDRLLAGAKPDGAHAQLGRGPAVDLEVVDEQRRARLHSETLERDLVDL